MVNLPNYTPQPSTRFQVGLGANKLPFVQGYDHERQEVPWFRWNAGTKQAIVLPRGPMLVSLDNTDGDADAVLKVGSYDTVHDLGLAYLGYAGATPASDVWTVPMGEKQTKVFTFLKDFLLVYVAGPFGTYPFVLQPMGLIERGCSSMPLASDGPFLTGGGA